MRACLGDAFDVAAVQVIQQRVNELAMGGRHLLLRERVASALVFPDLINVRIDAQLVERAAEKHHVGCQTDRE